MTDIEQDLAYIYQNQAEVGQGIKKAMQEVSGLKREDIFIVGLMMLAVRIQALTSTHDRPRSYGTSTTALSMWPQPSTSASSSSISIISMYDSSLLTNMLIDANLSQLYLIHWPVAFKHQGRELFPKKGDNEVDLDMDVTLVDTWKTMLDLPKSKAKAVGVSNFTVEMLEEIIKSTGETPAANQVERHPLIPDLRLMDYCGKKGIHITAYSVCPLQHVLCEQR